MMKTTQLPDMSPDGTRRSRARWARALVGAAVLVLLAPPAWATRVTDVRVGKHPTFTRVVFELDRPSGYQLERNEPAPGIAELVVSLRASSGGHEVVPPKSSLIEGIEIRSDGKSTTAHIRLSRTGLRLKEMMLSEPARIVLDVVDGNAESAASKPTAAAKPKPVAVAKPAPVVEPTPAPVIEPVPEPEPEPAAPIDVVSEPEPAIPAVDEPQGSSPASPSPYADDSAAAAGGAMEFANEAAEAPSMELPSAVPAEPKPVQIAMATPEPTTPPAQKSRTTMPGASSSNTMAQPEAGLFTLRNGAFALAGVGLLAAGGFVIARRRRDVGDFEDEEYDTEEAFGDDNPFAGLESAAPAEEAGDPVVSAFDETTADEGIVVGEPVEDENGQTDLFAGTPTAVEQEQDEPEIVVGGEAGADESNEEVTAAAGTEDSDMSMDGTSDFGADPNAVTAMPPVPGGGMDADAVMRLIREMETRIADVETRLEETVDAKERLERQVAAQTEELRVQRAAIARTQRAVRNMSQPVEDTPTEPALREPRPEDQ